MKGRRIAKEEGTYKDSVTDQRSMRLDQWTAKLVADPLLPEEQLLLSFALALLLVHVGRNASHQLQRFFDDGMRLEHEIRSVQWSASKERFEQHAIARNTLHGKEQISFERDLRMSRGCSTSLEEGAYLLPLRRCQGRECRRREKGGTRCQGPTAACGSQSRSLRCIGARFRLDGPVLDTRHG